VNVCVVGLWHLGTVTAACLAGAGHRVTGLDEDPRVVEGLSAGRPPLLEPGLEELVRQGLGQGRLSFTTDAAAALRDAEVVWIAYDTPVDEEDRADVEGVVARVTRLFPLLPPGALVLISSQLPVGTTRRLEEAHAAACPGRPASFACSPENLRLGKAIRVFTNPDRVVVGTRRAEDRQRIAELLRPITDRIEWMTVESAEMVKHAINAFLATSVAFINEIAGLCERTGADAREVSRGLKTDARIGPGAYLGAGAAFAGGTLARDLGFLVDLAERERRSVHLLPAVRESNEEQKTWPCRRLVEVLGNLSGRRLAVLGLTYKPGTSTLRRSSAVEVCRWLDNLGARVAAYDPAVRELPPDLPATIQLAGSPGEALAGADALLVLTEWPEFQGVSADEVCRSMRSPLVLDPGGFLEKQLGGDSRIRYWKVGKA